MKYDPEKFTKEYESPEGRKLWALLTEDTSIARMQTASDLDQPALKPMEDILLERMGKAILPDRMKQMAGHMVRQIMEHHGYVHDASDIKLASQPFYKASRYRKKDRDSLFLFRSSSDRQDIAVTDDRKGSNLPPLKDGSWQFINTISSPIKASIGYNFDLKKAVGQVKQSGFARYRVERMLRAAR